MCANATSSKNRQCQLLADTGRLHLLGSNPAKVRIPTAAIPHEYWDHAKAPDFFGEVRRRESFEIGASRWLFFLSFSNSLSQDLLSRTASQSGSCPLCKATFFNRWSGADGEKSNQINSLQMGIEELKL